MSFGALGIPHRTVSFGWRVIACVVTVILAAAVPVPAADDPAVCGSPQRSIVVLNTYDGAIEIEVFPEVAPEAVTQLLRLVEGPIFREGFSAVGPKRPAVGYFDSLLFDHAIPGTEFATSIRPPGSAVLIPMQIDATALGLEDRRVESVGAAMDVWQTEIIPYETSIHGRKEPPGLLGEWMEEWKETMRPDFLLGASQKDINEAMGYVYESGLPSLPVRRGSVGLRRISKEWSSPALIVALTDRPDLDGRRMIIGEVISDIETVDRISRRKLTPTKSEQFRPFVPVRITDGHVECRSASEADVAKE
jgi:cyclophilin family peptidyl-prolyl cis-trans isomerase